MLILRKLLPGIAFGLAVVAAASPSLAQRGEHEHRMDANRERIMHDCSVEAGKTTQSTSATIQLNAYRACMMQHGQQE